MDNNGPVTILALLTEMARCLNQNISKVKLTPIDPAFSTNPYVVTAAMPTQESNV